MSKHNHNYTQYSNKNHNPDNANYVKPIEQPVAKAPETKPEIKPDIKPVIVQETVETVALPETVEGFVVNCAKLNVRENASVDSGIVCVLNVMSDIRVDVSRTTSKWAYVYTATGLEGYCMREYIDARL